MSYLRFIHEIIGSFNVLFGFVVCTPRDRDRETEYSEYYPEYYPEYPEYPENPEYPEYPKYPEYPELPPPMYPDVIPEHRGNLVINWNLKDL